jgi:membrane-bound serine protease (ClpP class)
MVAELFFPPSVLSARAAYRLRIGAVMRSHRVPGFGVPLGLIATLAVVSALFGLCRCGRAQARRRPIVTGHEALIGSVRCPRRSGAGRVCAHHGEQWRVRSPVSIKRGQGVRVTSWRSASVGGACRRCRPGVHRSNNRSSRTLIMFIGLGFGFVVVIVLMVI